MPEPQTADRPTGAYGTTAPFLAKAPPLSIPMRHFAAAAVAFATFAAAFAWGAFGHRLAGAQFQDRFALGLVHTLTLGWITMTLFGAMTQLAPVLWETSLVAEKAVKAAWWLFMIGIIGFVGRLWTGGEYFWPAVPVASAFVLYLYSFLRTMASARQIDWTGKHLALSVGYLVVLATLGLILAYDGPQGRLLDDPETMLVAHVHLALIGWVSLAIMGVSYRLVAMFTLSHLESKTPGRLALALVNIGLIGLTVDCLAFGRRWMPLWAVILACGYAAYAYQVRRIFSARNRKIDPALAYTILAMIGGAVWAALGLSLAFGWLPNESDVRAAYVFCILVGWITPFILGQIHKIVPFLVWLHVYSKGWKPPARLPKMEELTFRPLIWAELTAFAPGVYCGIGGFLTESNPLLEASAALILGAAVLYLANLGITVRHMVMKES
ncbi:MAG: hypothetical protein KGO96_02875 [Elusimicrobia bacterium]|nr:hypothetical protein [Elusimicrobiota bacterium]MDE2424837.1 hypothetical protein [Elusimicrobiota bacterium]